MLRKTKLKIIITIISFFVLITNTNAKENKVDIYLIHSNTCPHCKEEIKFLNLVEKKYNNVNIHKYEIHKNSIENIESKHNITISSVPITIINNTIYNGFNDNTKIKILKTIDYYSKDRNIALNKYIKSTNYNIIGNITTNNLDSNITYTLLGILSIFNISNIITSIILIILINKNDIKNKLLLLLNYILVLFLLTINNTIYYKSTTISIIIYIFILLLLIYYLYKYLKNKSNNYLNYIIVIFLSIINKVIELLLLNKNIIILNNISKYELELLNKIINYSNYIMSYLLLDIILLLLIIKICKKINCLLKI